MKNKTEVKHTPTPWKHSPSIGEGFDAILSEHVNKGGNFYVAQCNNTEDAEFIVHAVNSHEALLEAVKAFVNGNMHDEKVLELAKKAIEQAEGGK